MFDNLEFKTVVSGRSFGEPYFMLKKSGETIRLVLSVEAVRLTRTLLDGYNAIDLLVAGDNVIAIKPKIKQKSKNQKAFTATGLRGEIKNIPFNKRLPVVIYRDMIVCDLRGIK